jgi:hypothetical protein
MEVFAGIYTSVEVGYSTAISSETLVQRPAGFARDHKSCRHLV